MLFAAFFCLLVLGLLTFIFVSCARFYISVFPCVSCVSVGRCLSFVYYGNLNLKTLSDEQRNASFVAILNQLTVDQKLLLRNLEKTNKKEVNERYGIEW